MKQLGRLWLLGTLLFLSVEAAGRAGEDGFQVLEPAPKSLHTEDSISCVVTVDPKRFDTLKISTDKNEQARLAVAPTRDTYCQTMPIRPGSNKIWIRGYSHGKKISEEVRTVYYVFPFDAEGKYVPRGFRPRAFHTGLQERKCVRCHDMRVNEQKNAAFADVTESNCYLCHKQITAKEQTHAPAVNWLCTGCHSGSAPEDGNDTAVQSRFLAPDPIRPACFRCHQRTEALWKDKKYRHHPVAYGSCNRCHNPHASPNRYTLRKPIWDLCRSCHSVKPSKEEYMKKFSTLYNHPLDPEQTGRELTCVSCHNPHVSDREFFLQPDYRGDASICRRTEPQ